jgi:SSS family solute:Na+ symporter
MSKGASVEEGSADFTFGLKAADYAAIAAYLVLTFGISVWFGRKQKNVDDYFVGGRRMPWFAVGLSILATLFSTLSYLGVPGEMIKHGVGLFTGYLSIPLTAFVVLYLWVPFFMRLRLTSAYEYLELRFGRTVRSLGAGLFILLRLGWMSMVTYAASFALDQVKGPDLEALPGPDIYWWIAIIGIISAIYTSIGGIQAMIWIDVIQCLLLLSGVLMAIGSVMYVDGTGITDWWRTAATEGPSHTSPEWWSWDVTVRMTVGFVMINNFFWTICTHGSDQVVLQRYFSTSSLRAARRSYMINLAVDLTMAALLATAGLALLAFYLKHPNWLPPDTTSAVNAADKLFPHFLGSRLLPGCTGLIIAAFLCDAIQTLESGVNAITAVVTNDFFNPSRTAPSDDVGKTSQLSEATKLKIARVLAILIGVTVTVAALGVAFLKTSRKDLTLVDMMPKFFNMFVGPLASMFFVGMFIPRCRTRTMIPSVILGIVVSVLWSWWNELTGHPPGPSLSVSVGTAMNFALMPGNPPSPFLAIVVPYLTTVITAFVLSLVFDSGADHHGRAFSWRAVMRRIPEPVEQA